MKLAVTSQGTHLHSPLEPRFSRARHFILVDTETGACSAVDNSANQSAAQGAGMQAAKRILELGAEAVLTGHVGPKAFHVLRVGGTKIYTGASGTVAEAVAQFQAGQLTQTASPDVEGYW